MPESQVLEDRGLDARELRKAVVEGTRESEVMVRSDCISDSDDFLRFSMPFRHISNVTTRNCDCNVLIPFEYASSSLWVHNSED